MSDTKRLDELVSGFRFNERMGRDSGSMVLQIDKSRFRRYGFGELLLLPYLQRAFKRDDDVTVGELRKKLERSSSIGASVLLDDSFSRPFYETILKKLNRDELVSLGPANAKIIPSSSIVEGNNYASARVRKIVRFYDVAPYRIAQNGANM